MRFRNHLTAIAMIVGLGLTTATAALAQTGDILFKAGFQDLSDGPTSDSEAARF